MNDYVSYVEIAKRIWGYAGIMRPASNGCVNMHAGRR